MEMGKPHCSGLCLPRVGCSTFISVSLSHFLEPFLGVILTAVGGDASLQGREGCSPGELSTYCVLGIVLANPRGPSSQEEQGENLVTLADGRGQGQGASGGHPLV